jgi:hypothetical protein
MPALQDLTVSKEFTSTDFELTALTIRTILAWFAGESDACILY